MFGDIGWAELLLIGIVALIIIGPEDLPHMFRQIGRFTAKLRAMSRDFSRAMEQAAKESGVKDVTDNLKGATSATSLGLNKVKAAADRFEKWDPLKTPVKPVTPSVATAAAPATIDPVNVAATQTPTIHGAATQALIDKQAAKKAVLAQTAEKLKAINAGESVAIETKPAPKRRSVKAAPIAEPLLAEAVPTPRATRKPKKAIDA
jgi:sec-independent protein translocase protein TatB